MRTLVLGTLLVTAAACGDNGNNKSDAAVDTGKAIDAMVDARPGAKSMTLAGGANDLLWNATTSTLYFTDDNTNDLMKYTDANGIQVVGTFPTITGPNPGGLVQKADGTILTVQFGAGANGRLDEMSPAGVGASYTGLDATIKWLDLEQGPDGTLYAIGFKGNSAAPIGRIFTLALDSGTHVATPTELLGPDTTNMEQLKKIVGAVVTADAIYLSDQTQNQIIKYTLPGLVASTVATGLPSADYLIQLPNGDFLTGGSTGKLTRIKASDGTLTMVDTTGVTLTTVHGLAFDQAKHRLFAIDHPASGSDTLNIIPFGGMN
jgi:hypothetical protein